MITSLNDINQLLFVTESALFFEVGTEFLNIIQMNCMVRSVYFLSSFVLESMFLFVYFLFVCYFSQKNFMFVGSVCFLLLFYLFIFFSGVISFSV
jgi:uncharacterized membrane protein YozB (DUF420 family)